MNDKLKSLVELARQQKESNSSPQQIETKVAPKKEAKEKSSIIPMTEEAPNLPTLMSLSLDYDEEITKEVLMNNVKLEPRELKGSPEAFKRARRKVGKLTTGASAATPLLCRGEACPFKDKCVTGDTLVYTPEGLKKITSLSKGSIIYSMNWDGTLEEDLIVNKKKTGEKPVFEIKTEYGLTLKLTSDHRVLTELENGRKVYKSIDSGLKEGSSVFIIDPDLELDIDSESYGDVYEDKIESITPKGVKPVYDITVESNSNFFANNILVHNCHYFLEDLHEEGENCLKEEQLIEYWTQKYFEDLGIDVKSISEMHALSRLVEITIMDLRMTEFLSINNPDLMMDFVTSADLNGAPLTQKGVSVAFEVKERLEKQKLKLLESLNSTREKRLKAAVDTAELGRADKSQNLMDKLEKIAASLRGEREGVVIDHE